jgi:hypothetical protein
LCAGRQITNYLENRHPLVSAGEHQQDDADGDHGQNCSDCDTQP